jgi:DNA-binding NarL/FixJ family response regulator
MATMGERLLLADDHAVFVEALAKLLRSRYEVVEVVSDGRALCEAARRHEPDVIITDITMPLMNGLDAVRALRSEVKTAKVVFLTMHAELSLVRECFQSGASAFLVKHCAYDELCLALDAVFKGETYVSSAIANEFVAFSNTSATTSSKYEQLSLRQREILQLFAEGKTTKDIAAIVNLSTRTVEWHKYRMMRMLGLQRSAELVQFAARMKLVS